MYLPFVFIYSRIKLTHNMNKKANKSLTCGRLGRFSAGRNKAKGQVGHGAIIRA